MKADDTLSQQATYRSAHGVVWAVQPAELLVLDEIGGHCLHLRYPEAAVWDFLTQGRTLQQISKLLQFLLDGSAEKARTVVDRNARRWLEGGWIVPVGTEPPDANPCVEDQVPYG